MYTLCVWILWCNISNLSKKKKKKKKIILRFGFVIDGVLGAETQINTPTPNWVDFWRKYRFFDSFFSSFLFFFFFFFFFFLLLLLLIYFTINRLGYQLDRIHSQYRDEKLFEKVFFDPLFPFSFPPFLLFFFFILFSCFIFFLLHSYINYYLF